MWWLAPSALIPSGGLKLFMGSGRFFPMEAPESPRVTRKAVLLRTGPDPRGFLSRYLLALTPLVILAASVIVTGMMRAYITGTFSSALSGPAQALLPGMGDLMEMAILLTAPVSLYLTFVIIGWRAHSLEMWTGSALAMGLAGLAGYLLFTTSPDVGVSPALDLLYWIAYLTAPASLIAVILVLGFVEQYRRSISYTIAREGLVLQGGLFRKKEHLLPWHHIGGLVMEQGFLGKRLGTGTIIPLVTGNPGATGGASGKEPSRSPLDCLSGIREPALVMEFLRELVARSRGADEELTPLAEDPEGR